MCNLLSTQLRRRSRMHPLKKQAHIAGALYLLVALIAPLGLQIVPAKLFVYGNVTATADHLHNAAALMRWGIASELLHQALEVWLGFALYRLLRDVNRQRAQELLVVGMLSI